MIDTYELEDGSQLRLTPTKAGSLLVKPDVPPEQSQGGILFPNGAMTDVNNTGTIVAVGKMLPKKTKKRKDGTTPQPFYPPGLEPGDKVMFVRFLAEQESNKQIRHQYGGAIRIKPMDVLLVYTPDEEHRFTR